MSVLITGVSGYVGSNLAKRLRRDGQHVIGLDRVSNDNVLHWLHEFYEGDYVETGGLADLFERYDIDTVFHMAATSLVFPSLSMPLDYYENNVAKCIVFFNFLKDLPNPPKIIFSSSSSVYGERGPEPIPEVSLDVPMPNSPYAQTKWMVENILADMKKAYGTQSISLRYFNIAGANREGDLGQDPNGTYIITSMLRSVLNGKTFTMFGTENELVDTTCRRDYVHVEDIVDANVLAMNKLHVNKRLPLAINIGTGSGTSNKEILAYIQQNIGPLKVEWKPERITDIKFLIPDTTLAKQHLGFEAKYSDLKTLVDTAWVWQQRNTK